MVRACVLCGVLLFPQLAWAAPVTSPSLATMVRRGYAVVLVRIERIELRSPRKERDYLGSIAHCATLRRIQGEGIADSIRIRLVDTVCPVPPVTTAPTEIGREHILFLDEPGDDGVYHPWHLSNSTTLALDVERIESLIRISALSSERERAREMTEWLVAGLESFAWRADALYTLKEEENPFDRIQTERIPRFAESLSPEQIDRLLRAIAAEAEGPRGGLLDKLMEIAARARLNRRGLSLTELYRSLGPRQAEDAQATIRLYLRAMHAPAVE